MCLPCCPAEAVQYLFVVLFVGSVYPRMSVTGQSAVVDRLAVMFMWVTALLVTAPARALIAWDMERKLLRLVAGGGDISDFIHAVHDASCVLYVCAIPMNTARCVCA